MHFDEKFMLFLPFEFLKKTHLSLSLSLVCVCVLFFFIIRFIKPELEEE